ncbi:poly(ADP-ribose) glycohydrolase-like [Sitodiplosis mosellana]|uniref:poly(ADP-ribose) glycohydrolase-like n=1 Tax=Sitodiplosis mosellana TaxID=263140 RepID=UPI0024443E49|nr:poly(ADP-ribose) glycohydrolase-like [Sitodiplosis mosellana]XP_055295118.1 poly(ADP-ribose) glycohydrolase-like [Sitodiplosis mosellana]
MQVCRKLDAFVTIFAANYCQLVWLHSHGVQYLWQIFQSGKNVKWTSQSHCFTFLKMETLRMMVMLYCKWILPTNIRLFTESLEDNECLTIMGFERFNDYKGHGMSFEWTGDHKDVTPLDSFRRRKCTLVAIDAYPFGNSNRADQYREYMLKRELIKAFVGFEHELSTPAPGVATGNWGCGAFNGDTRLKAILQLMACVVNDRPLVYFTFGSKKLRDDLVTFHKYLSDSKITIAELWDLLKGYTESKSKEPLYEFIKSGYEKSIQEKSTLSKFDQFCSTLKRHLNVLIPKRTDDDNKSDDTEDGIHDLPLQETSLNDDFKASGSKDLKTQLSVADFFKSFTMESENIAEDIGASKSS